MISFSNSFTALNNNNNNNKHDYAATLFQIQIWEIYLLYFLPFSTQPSDLLQLIIIVLIAVALPDTSEGISSGMFSFPWPFPINRLLL